MRVYKYSYYNEAGCLCSAEFNGDGVYSYHTGIYPHTREYHKTGDKFIDEFTAKLKHCQIIKMEEVYNED